MDELLNNAVLQGAIIIMIVAALNGLTAWVKSKTKSEIIDKYWCYIQPVIDGAIDSAETAAKNKATSPNVYERIIARGVVDYVNQFEKFELKEPTARQKTAVEAEIRQAVTARVGG